MKKVTVVFGTRPEAIKMAPVIRALRSRENIRTTVLATAQHRQMLDQAISVFDIKPDIDLDLMQDNQDLSSLFGRVLDGVHHILSDTSPDMVLVHGDTTTTLAASLAAFYAQIPVGHVEAGLRTHDLKAPWPEEMNRRVVTPLARIHFAPTSRAARNLRAEGVAEDTIHVTGNTVVDALLQTTAKLDADPLMCERLDRQLPQVDSRRPLVLVTSHRRENFGSAFQGICSALAQLAADGVQIVYPVHPNPNISGTAYSMLQDVGGIHLTQPLDYLPFVRVMQRADLILTDSGGIQEEAPSLGKPVLLMRRATERPEGLESGAVRLVGSDPLVIVSEARRLLADKLAYQAMAGTNNPFGDGLAAQRIADLVEEFAG